MKKLLVLLTGTWALTATATAYAEPAAPAGEVDAAVVAYDECLASATLRAKRSGAPLRLQHDQSKRSCKKLRASLLDDASGNPAVAAALDEVDQTRLDYVDIATGVKSADDLAYIGNPRLHDMIAREQLRQGRARDSQLSRGPQSQPQSQPQTQPGN